MKFNIILSDKDVADFFVCNFSNMPEFEDRYKKIRFSLFFTIVNSVFLIYFFLFYRNEYGIFINILIGLIVGFLVSVVLVLPIVKISYKKLVYSNFERLKDKVKYIIINQFIIEFNDNEIKQVNDFGFINKKYSDITRILTDKEHIYIMVGAVNAAILPLRCLGGREKELLDFIHSKM